jgi:hypothetical protein
MSNQFETPRSANDNETIKKKILNGKIQMKTHRATSKEKSYTMRIIIGSPLELRTWGMERFRMYAEAPTYTHQPI